VSLWEGTAITGITADTNKRAAALAHITFAPVMALVLSVGGRCLIGRVIYPFLGLIWLVAVVAQGYAAALELAADSMVPFIHYYCRLTVALLLLIGWMHALHKMETFAMAFINAQDDAFRMAKPVRKWTEIMKSFCTWGVPGKDAYYTFSEYSTAVDVLHEMWMVFHHLAIGSGLMLFLSFYLFGASEALDDEPEFNWQHTLLFLWIGCGTLLLFVGMTAPAFQNLARIAISKPFYLGDIVNLHKADEKGGIGGNVTGFIENFTFSYIVVRSFDLKQVWISHSDFAGLTVTNWTRRPTKLVHLQIGLAYTSDPAAVQQLLGYIQEWISTNENVRPKSYKKATLKGIDPGYVLAIIVYPKVGFSKAKLRSSLLFDVMEAAKKLKLSLIALDTPQFLSGPVGKDENGASVELLTPTTACA